MNYILKGKLAIEEPNLLRWAEWYETHSRRVKEDFVNGYRISTVFLGIDHRFSVAYKRFPILFETMVFDKGSYDDLRCERYSHWEEAEAGHKKMVAKVKKWKKKK